MCSIPSASRPGRLRANTGVCDISVYMCVYIYI